MDWICTIMYIQAMEQPEASIEGTMLFHNLGFSYSLPTSPPVATATAEMAAETNNATDFQCKKYAAKKAITAKGTMNNIPEETALRAKPLGCVFFKPGLIHLRNMLKIVMLINPNKRPTSIP